LLEVELLFELELELDDPVDCVEDPLAEVVWPWKDFAAASEMTPVRATAPAITHRLMREIRANPASRVLVALGGMYPMIGPTRKKMLSRV
jgi:hypothetical protein